MTTFKKYIGAIIIGICVAATVCFAWFVVSLKAQVMALTAVVQHHDSAITQIVDFINKAQTSSSAK